MKEFLLDNRGDMVEKGLIMAAIVVAAIFLWVSIDQKLVVKLGIVDASSGRWHAHMADQSTKRYGRECDHLFQR